MARLSGQGLFFLIASGVLLLDQGSKYLLRQLVPWGETREIIPGLFDLVHVWNTGVAFGLFAHHPAWGRYLLLLINLLAFFVFYLWAKRASSLRQVVLCGLVAGGALGNLLDRLFFGRVFDFLDFHLGPYHWPAFNLADAAISCGVILLLGENLLRRSSK